MAQCPANKAEKRDIFHNLKRLAPVINQLPTWVPTRDSWPHRSVSCSTACYCINRLFFFFNAKERMHVFLQRQPFSSKKPMVFVYTCFLNTLVQLQWYGLFLYRSIFVWCDLVQVGCESVCRVCVCTEKEYGPKLSPCGSDEHKQEGKGKDLVSPHKCPKVGSHPPTTGQGAREHPRWHHTGGVVSLQAQQQDQQVPI